MASEKPPHHTNRMLGSDGKPVSATQPSASDVSPPSTEEGAYLRHAGLLPPRTSNALPESPEEALGILRDSAAENAKAYHQSQRRGRGETARETVVRSIEEVRQKENHMGGADNSDRDFWVGITGFGAIFGAGVYVLAEQQWLFGSIFTIGGGAGLLSMSPLIRNYLLAWPSRKTLFIAIALTWVFLAANIVLSILGTSKPIATGNTWAGLTDEQKASLELVLSTLPKHDKFQIICLTSDCKNLSVDFLRAFDSAGWSASLTSFNSYNQPYGLVLYQLNEKDRSLADAIERATKIKITHIYKTDLPNVESLSIGIRP